VRPATSSISPQNRDRGEERVGVGGARVFRLLVAGIALFCLGISLSFLASATTTTTTEVCCAHMGKAFGDAEGEASVRPDKDATSGLLPTPGEEDREGEKLSRGASLLMSILVLAASSFFRSGSVLVGRNSSLKGASAVASGRASLLGVFLL
jgi:hypothetical protein